MFRMEKEIMIDLDTILEQKYGLRPSRRMFVIEKLGIFLYTIALNASNRHAQERFRHSGETISRVFKQVLHATCFMSMDLVKPSDPDFNEIPSEVLNDSRYMPHFKDCIGAIDGTHVRACVALEEQVPYIGRKGIPTQNIMAACSFDMQFMFVWAGWEGTAHDTRIFLAAINDPNIKFPKPPEGKYYVVDAGYPNIKGYLEPYKGVKYHIPEFRRGQQPSGKKEIFNRAHSSLRNVIERTFGVWKKRWQILDNMPSYPYKTQVKIVVASMALHNYIRRKSRGDPIFQAFDQDPDFVPPNMMPDVPGAENERQQHNENSQMNDIRDQIANSLILSR